MAEKFQTDDAMPSTNGARATVWGWATYSRGSAPSRAAFPVVRQRRTDRRGCGRRAVVRRPRGSSACSFRGGRDPSTRAPRARRRAEKFDEEVPVPSGSEHDSDVAVRAWQHVVEPVSRAGALDGKERIDVEIIRDDHGPWHEAAERRLLRADLDALPVTGSAPLEDRGGAPSARAPTHSREPGSQEGSSAADEENPLRGVRPARRGREGLEMPMGSFTGESQVGERHVDQTGCVAAIASRSSAAAGP